MKTKSHFIVFEGIDGSGSSTQASLLVNYLNQISIRSILTSEPSEGPIGSLIRQIMKHRIKIVTDPVMFDHQLAYLFAADRHDHLYNEEDGVMKFLNEGVSVVSTRYYFSSYAYHCTSDDDFELVQGLNSRFPKPDLLIYLDQPVRVSLSRIASRKYKEVYENERKLNSVYTTYEKLLASYDGNLLRVDATKGIDEIHTEISNVVRALYGM